MHPPELQMSVSLPSVVELVRIRDLGQEGARVFG